MKNIFYFLSIIIISTVLSGCSLFGKGGGPNPGGGGDGPQGGGGGGPCQRCAQRDAEDRQRELDRQGQGDVVAAPRNQPSVLDESGSPAGRPGNSPVQNDPIENPAVGGSGSSASPIDGDQTIRPDTSGEDAAPAFSENEQTGAATRQVSSTEPTH